MKAISLAHRQLIGCRFGNKTRFAILDIDAGSPYHDKTQLHRLIDLFTEAGLTEPAIYRSSHSDGWHLYFFFDEAVPTKELQNLFEQLLKGNGFAIQKGRLEVFPNRSQNSLGYGIRLPLQLGFAWLNAQTLDVDCERQCLSAPEALWRFMSDLNHFSSSHAQYSQLKRTVAEQKLAFAQIDAQLERALTGTPRTKQAASELALHAVIDAFAMIPPGIDSEVWCRGRDYLASGLTGPGQRADAVFCLSHYLFYGDPKQSLDPLGYGFEQERRHAIESILAMKHNGNSNDYNRGRQDAVAHIGRAALWLPAHKRAEQPTRYLKGTPISWVRHNANLKSDTQLRITAAVDHFVAAARPFTTQELMARARVKSTSTLYAHKALWHPLYEQLKALSPDISDEYNAVVGAAAPQSGALPQDSEQNMPVGRLAARAVVAALSRRTEQEKQTDQKDIEISSTAYAQTWRSQVEAAMPPEIGAADAHQLKACMPVVLALLARAPDEEHQIWLQRQVKAVKARLQSLREEVVLTVCESEERTG